jgi:hypothetical protein
MSALVTADDFMPRTQESLRRLVAAPEWSDVTLVCDDLSRLPAHSLVLSLASPVLASLLHPGPATLFLRGLSRVQGLALLDFLYTGQARLGRGEVEAFQALLNEFQILGWQGRADQTSHKEAAIKQESRPVVEMVVVPEILTQEQSDTNLEDKDEKPSKKKRMALKKQACDLCGFRSPHQRRWVKHDMKCPPPGPSTCKECGAEFSLETQMKKHMLKNHTKKQCGEDQCDYESEFPGQMKVHKRTEHETINNECDMCKESYRGEGSLRRHMNRVHDGRRLTCGNCAFMALTNNKLALHMKVKHGC